MTDYSAERYDPKLASCSTLVLRFNGTTLKMEGGSVEHTYSAVSGVPRNDSFYYSWGAQQQKRGPIPEGVYWINPDELRSDLFNRWSTASWGRSRITIHPFATTAVGDRGGFFIHGGADPGSIGCIDLVSHMDRFVQDLFNELIQTVGFPFGSCQIHLHVRYRGEGPFPMPQWR